MTSLRRGTERGFSNPPDERWLSLGRIEITTKEQILHGGLLYSLGTSLGSGSFDTAREILTEAELTPAEAHHVAQGIANMRNQRDPNWSMGINRIGS